MWITYDLLINFCPCDLPNVSNLVYRYDSPLLAVFDIKKKKSWMKSHKVKYDRWQKEIQSTTTHFRWETFQSVNNPVVITSWLCAQKLELNSHIVVQPNMSSIKVLWLNLLLEGSKVSTPNVLHFLFSFLFIETKMSFSVTGGNGLLQPREKICMGMSLRFKCTGQLQE